MRKILIAVLSLIFVSITNHLINAQKISRDLNVHLLINQAGYLPEAGKKVVLRGTSSSRFEVIDVKTLEVVYTGKFQSDDGDFGRYSVGDFSQLSREGHYYVRSDTLRSYPFEISLSVYRKPVEKITAYFSLQRCGPSTTGYLSPCHVDDGIRMDSGRHQDVTGGWHDASDLRKWVSATIYGMIGLSKTYELLDNNDPLRPVILDELRWGNQYFLKMQEPAGYIMNFVGGDVKKHSDSNRWTDNIPGKEGGELAFVKPSAGRSNADMLIFGTNDDRVIRTDPVDLIAQYNFVASEAAMTRITRDKDPEYSRKCLEAAKRCFDWCTKEDKELTAGIAGASVHAAIEMYRTTNQVIYRDFAIRKANDIKKLQAPGGNNPSGFLYTSESEKEPYKDIWHGCLELISLCDIVRLLPENQNVPVWRDMIDAYTNQYLKFFSGKNSYGIVPFGLFTGKDPGGNKKAGEYWYRYFMQPEQSWWVGINANLASSGVGLIKASQVLNDPHLKILAQSQLDWITGVNPFNSSTIVGVGYNHPKHFPGSTFLPNTPVLPGAVLNGLGGDSADQPSIGNGDWQISEYWTPMVAYTLWLLTEITETE